MQVGQTVWVTGGFANKGIVSDVISKIGNKYFYLAECGNMKFDLHTLKSVSDSNYPYTVWLSILEYQNVMKTNELTDKIRKFFSGWRKINLSLSQLQQIDKIISEEEDIQ